MQQTAIRTCLNDMWFDVERWNTQDQRTPVAVSSAIAALPNLTLPGTLGSLHQAMARDTSGQLMAAVQTSLATDEKRARADALTQVLFRWAGVHGVAPGSRGYVIGDARYLVTLERVFRAAANH